MKVGFVLDGEIVSGLGFVSGGLFGMVRLVTWFTGGEICFLLGGGNSNILGIFTPKIGEDGWVGTTNQMLTISGWGPENSSS